MPDRITGSIATAPLADLWKDRGLLLLKLNTPDLGERIGASA